MKPKAMLTMAATAVVLIHSSLAATALPEFKSREEIRAIRAEQAAAKESAFQADHEQSGAAAFYTGKAVDAETGNYLFLYRNYDPELNRWSTVDPSGYPDGANNSAYLAVPTSEFDWQGLISVSFRALTLIRPPDSQDGIKSSHLVVVDTATGAITSDVQFFGTTTLMGVSYQGYGTLTATLNSVDDCHINLTMTGSAGSALLPASFTIDYSFTINLDLHVGNNGAATLSGQHDGYPSYEYYVNGTKHYDFAQGALADLQPPMEINVSRTFNTGVENSVCE